MLGKELIHGFALFQALLKFLCFGLELVVCKALVAFFETVNRFNDRLTLFDELAVMSTGKSFE